MLKCALDVGLVFTLHTHLVAKLLQAKRKNLPSKKNGYTFNSKVHLLNSEKNYLELSKVIKLFDKSFIIFSNRNVILDFDVHLYSYS